MHRIVELIPKRDFHLYVRYDDGTSGEVDLSSLRGKGVFARWELRGEFEKVVISHVTGAPTWPGEIDICPDTLYYDIIGHNPLESLTFNATSK